MLMMWLISAIAWLVLLAMVYFAIGIQRLRQTELSQLTKNAWYKVIPGWEIKRSGNATVMRLFGGMTLK